MKNRIVTSVAMAAALAVGCSKESAKEGPAKGESAVGKSAPPTAAPPPPPPTWKAGEPVTVDVLVQLGQALAPCQIETGTSFGIRDCAEYKRFQQAMSTLAMVDAARLGNQAAAKLITNPAPAVRALAAQYLASITGTDVAGGEVIATAMAVEKDPAVLSTMIRMAGPVAPKSEKVAAAVIEATTHADRWVRFHAVVVLGRPGVPRNVATLVEVLGRDRDDKVKDLACELLGGLGDASAMPALEQHTAAITDAQYAGCMRGLVQMWASYPFFKNASRPAYELTLKRIRAKPHGEKAPPFTIFSNLVYLADPNNKDAKSWRGSNPWFEAPVLIEALGDVIADPDAGYMPRSSALKAALAHGATKQQLVAWRAPYGDKPAGKDASIVADLDKAISTAK